MSGPIPPVGAPSPAEFDQLRSLFLAGDLQAAQDLASALLIRAPAQPDLVNLLGLIAYRRGRFTEAVTRLRAAAALAPADGGVQANLGAALRAVGDLPGAEAVYHQALELAPDNQALHANLANVLLDQLKMTETEQRVQRALQCGPPSSNLMMTLALSLNRQGRLVEAVAAFRTALELDPDNFDACRNLGATLAGLAQFDEAEGLHRRALALRPDYAAGHSSLLFALNYRPDLTAEAIAEQCRQFDRVHAEPLRRSAAPQGAVVRAPHERLRLGYVSPDFTDHVVATFMVPLLEAHDKYGFELYCYAEVRNLDATSRRVMDLADHWINTVGLSDEALADRIAADEIDILVDLAGHTSGNRLLAFARHPAPVQLTYFIGHGATTGLSAIDGFIADERLAPPGSEALFGEAQVVRLDRTPLAFVPAPHMPPVAPSPALAGGAVTFGYFGRSIRLNEGVIEVWSRILTDVPNARLMLNNAPFGDPQTAALFAARFARYGVDPARLLMVNTRPQSRTWAAYGQVDIALDPFPHNAGTTTIEALWMGVPVLTLADRPTVGRMGAMILGGLGLEDWVAATPQDYVARAVKAAEDPAGLARLRADLRPRFMRSPLADAVGLVRALEATYRRLWRERGERG